MMVLGLKNYMFIFYFSQLTNLIYFPTSCIYSSNQLWNLKGMQEVLFESTYNIVFGWIFVREWQTKANLWLFLSNAKHIKFRYFLSVFFPWFPFKQPSSWPFLPPVSKQSLQVAYSIKSSSSPKGRQLWGSRSPLTALLLF